MKLDSDLWRVRFALRVVAGLNAAVAALLFTKGDWPLSLVCGVVGLVCGVAAFSVYSRQRTRDLCREIGRTLERRANEIKELARGGGDGDM